MSDDHLSTTRRDLLKLLGAVPLAAALDLGAARVGRAARLAAALGDADARAFVPRFFSAHEWRTVRVLVDDILPRDERSGSATEAKVPEFMDFMLADADTAPAARTAMRGGLAWLDAECHERFGAPFAACSTAHRHRLLDDIAWPARARPELSQGAAFFTAFRDLTASGFYATPMGWRDVGYEGNVFHASWQGCPEPALRKLGVAYSDGDVRPGG
ncbi:MAG TPA: gluconate 2-dehydrogenase subunit 3 family protein [Gemmatimonadaceae bacterium]|nr:gluconate 2-dehydrogenase subunit 3 family protein [Gemmatimonadaceae bacterium]